jgi:hypothetical protein
VDIGERNFHALLRGEDDTGNSDHKQLTVNN